MITQSLYRVLCRAQERAGDNNELKEGLRRFTTPYALVIHRKSKQGWYVDDGHQPIIEVSDCVCPENYRFSRAFCEVAVRPH